MRKGTIKTRGQLLEKFNLSEEDLIEIENYINNKKVSVKPVKKLKILYPNIKGFDKRSLYLMIQLYKTYSDNEIVGPLVPQISWSNNVVILKRTKKY